MAGQKRKIGIKAIKKALTDCAFDPDQPGWMKVVAEADDNYLLRRSIEMLSVHLASPDYQELAKAIGLLGLLRARINERVQA